MPHGGTPNFHQYPISLVKLTHTQETYETWKRASTVDLLPTRVCEDTIGTPFCSILSAAFFSNEITAFMFHISVKLGITDYASNRSGVLHGKLRVSDIRVALISIIPESLADQWDDLQAHFLEHLDEINDDLVCRKLPLLGQAPEHPKTSTIPINGTS